MPNRAFAARLILSCLLLNLSACSTLRSVSIGDAMRESPPPGVDYGSLVQVTMLDRRSAEFRVTVIAEDGLGGKPGFFAYEDMQSLEVREEGDSSTNAVGWIVGLLGVAALVALIAKADDVRVCSPSPCGSPP